jgi:hypothetical protein
MKKIIWFAGLLFGLSFLAGCVSAPKPTSMRTPSEQSKAGIWSDFTVAELTRSYGPATFVRKEDGSEIWRYDVGACRFFFFFYPGERGLTVRHVESIPSGRGQPIDADCLNAFQLRYKKS